MATLWAKGIVFDMYGTLVDVAEACKEVAPKPVAFNSQWRAKQLEYAFLRTPMGKYRDFWKVAEEAMEFAIQRFALQMMLEQRRRLMEAWLCANTVSGGGGFVAQAKRELYRLVLKQWG
jgi:FMN phosphatase YigB (HAD superfamily)